MSYTLLIVEDNQDLRESLQEYFETASYTVLAYESAEAAEPALNDEIDLAVIDINLPGKSGFSLIRDIRGLGFDFPLIALTARDQLEDKIRGQGDSRSTDT